MRSLNRVFVALLSALVMYAAPAAGQSSSPPTTTTTNPVVDSPPGEIAEKGAPSSVDDNGVDVMTGQPSFESGSIVSIGPSNGRLLKFNGYRSKPEPSPPYVYLFERRTGVDREQFGFLSYGTAGGGTATIVTVSLFGEQHGFVQVGNSEVVTSFNPDGSYNPNSVYYPKDGGLQFTLSRAPSPSGRGFIYTYTTRDGTIAKFEDENKAYTTSYYWNLPGDRAIWLSSITFPDGEIYSFSTKKAICSTDCKTRSAVHYRISAINSNKGYMLKFEYGADGIPSAATIFNWLNITSVTAINTNIEACDPTADHCVLSGNWPKAFMAVSTASIIDPNPDTLYIRGANHTTVTDPLGRTSTYDQGGFFGIINPGSTSSNTYNVMYNFNAGGRVSSVNRDGVSYNYTYLYTNQFSTQTVTTTVSLPSGASRVYTSNLDRRVITSIQDELGRTTNYTYDGSGKITEVRLPEGNRVQYSYDGRSNRTETRFIAKVAGSPADVVTSTSYSATCPNYKTCNKPLSAIDPRGGVTEYTYDPNHGGMLTVTAPAPSAGAIRPQTRYSYTAINGVTLLDGTSTCRTSAICIGTSDESKTMITYDGNLRPITTAVASGDGALSATTSQSYDAVGNIISVDGPLPGSADTTRSFYDIARQSIGTIGPDPDGAGALNNLAQRITFNLDGLVTKIENGTTDGQSDAAWNGFTALQHTMTTYDTAGRKTRVIGSGAGAVWQVTDFSYDVLDRPLCSAIRMNPSAWSTITDACVLMPQGPDGADRITRNNYDAAGQLLKITKAYATADQADDVTYTYTLNGKKATLTDANGNKAALTYDGFDRQIGWYFPDKVAVGAVSTTDYEAYGYDANGNRTSFRKRDGQVISYSFDALNRVAHKGGVTTADVDYTYDLQNQEKSAIFSSSGQGITNAYDGLGRLISATNTMGGVSRTLSYQYDLGGNRTRVTHPDGVFFVYEYDGLNRLSGVRENGGGMVATISYNAQGLRSSGMRAAAVSSYGYDGFGRLASWSDDLAGISQDLTTTFGYNPASQLAQQTRSNDGYAWRGAVNVDRTYAVNGLNQYTTAGTAAFQYDANGNLTSDGAVSYAYDSENRMVATSAGVSLVYDPNGRLYQTSGGSWATNRFLYDGDELVAEYDGANTLLRRFVHGSGEDDPLLWYEGAGLGLRRGLQGDHQGSIVSVADAGAAAIAINTYDEYGIPGSANMGRFQYTGQAWLSELGMYYYKARIYSPTLGRFLQTDPIGYKDQTNLYAYVYNDPVNNEDPSGECGPICGAIIGAGIDYGIQVASNLGRGQSLRNAATNVSLKSIAISAALGAVGNVGISRLTRLGVGNLSIASKGRLGEGIARAGITLRGGRVIAEQQAARRVPELAGRVSGRAGRAVPDFVVRRANGTVGVVEAKFGTSKLTGAQRALEGQMGADFRVARTTSEGLESAAGGTAAAAAGGANSQSRCSFDPNRGC